MPRWPERRRRATLALALGLAAAAATVTAAADRLEAARRIAPPERVLYLPRGKSFGAMSLGYDGLAADLVWVRGVLYAGRGLRAHETKYEWLARIYEVTTDLDPHWQRPYVWGARLLSALPQDDERALGLLSAGLERNPESAEIPFAAAQLLLLRGRNEAALRWLRLIDRPDRPEIKLLIAEVEREGNDYRAALAQAAGALAAERAPLTREVAARVYRETLARLSCQTLADGWAAWRARSGRPPADLADLVGRKGFREQFAERLAPLVGSAPAEAFAAALPRDPYGLEFVVRADGSVRSRGLERLELCRLLRTVDRYLERLSAEHGRPAGSLDELESYLAELDRSGRLSAEARGIFPGARLPPRPDGGQWQELALKDGRLLPPEKPGEAELLSAPLEMPAPSK